MGPSRSRLETNLRNVNHKLLVRLRDTELEAKEAHLRAEKADKEVNELRTKIRDVRKVSEAARLISEDRLSEMETTCNELRKRAQDSETLVEKFRTSEKEQFQSVQQRLAESETRVDHLARVLRTNQATILSLTRRLEETNHRIPTQYHHYAGFETQTHPQHYVRVNAPVPTSMSAPTSIPTPVIASPSSFPAASTPTPSSASTSTSTSRPLGHCSSVPHSGNQLHHTVLEPSRQQKVILLSTVRSDQVHGPNHNRGCFRTVTDSISALWSCITHCIQRLVWNNSIITDEQRQHHHHMQQQRLPLLPQ